MEIGLGHRTLRPLFYFTVKFQTELVPTTTDF